MLSSESFVYLAITCKSLLLSIELSRPEVLSNVSLSKKICRGNPVKFGQALKFRHYYYLNLNLYRKRSNLTSTGLEDLHISGSTRGSLSALKKWY